MLRFGSLAQSVEQRTFNPLVAGSNPARPTNNKRDIPPFALTGEGDPCEVTVGMFADFFICGTFLAFLARIVLGHSRQAGTGFGGGGRKSWSVEIHR